MAGVSRVEDGQAGADLRCGRRLRQRSGRGAEKPGKLRTREYDSSDGMRKVTTEIVADIMQLLDRRDGASERDTDGETDLNGVAPALATAG
jgi:hypothetical protein